jgi:hypothetical protein
MRLLPLLPMSFFLCRFLTSLAALTVVVVTLGDETTSPKVTNGLKFDDFLLVPLRVHLLSAEKVPDLNTTFSEKDFARILPKMNRVWAQAGVCFYLESVVKEEARAGESSGETQPRGLNWLLQHCPVETKATNAFNIYYVKQFGANGVYFPKGIFVKDTASLRKVEGGIDEPLPRVTSHELGHALSLPHRQDTTNLMASGTTGTWLSDAEIQRARDAARKLPWIRPAPVVLQQADALRAAGKSAEAQAWYERLSAIPRDNEPVKRAAETLVK